jgi:phage terminase large subunit-like protein
LHENRWTTSEAPFIAPTEWDGCVDPTLQPLLPTKDRLISIGVDVGIKHDASAVVAVAREGSTIRLVRHRIWHPTAQYPLDLEQTVEAFILDLARQYRVFEVLCDPYQFQRSMATLARAGIKIVEWAQTQARTTEMGQTLLEALKGRTLRMYPAPELREQALQTILVESPRGFRIVKESTTQKIDAIVALAMAVVSSMRQPDPPPADRVSPKEIFALPGGGIQDMPYWQRPLPRDRAGLRPDGTRIREEEEERRPPRRSRPGWLNYFV